MRVAEIWKTVRDFFSHQRLEEAKQRHQCAADRLDRAVKEILKE